MLLALLRQVHVHELRLGRQPERRLEFSLSENYGEMNLYKVIVRKQRFLNVSAFPIDETVTSKYVCLVDVGGPCNRLYHWANDNIRIDDNEIKNWLFLLQELPRKFLRKDLGNIVAGLPVYWILRLYGLGPRSPTNFISKDL